MARSKDKHASVFQRSNESRPAHIEGSSADESIPKKVSLPFNGHPYILTLSPGNQT